MVRVSPVSIASPWAFSLAILLVTGCGPSGSSGSSASEQPGADQASPDQTAGQTAEREATTLESTAGGSRPAQLSWTFKGADGRALVVEDGQVKLETVYFQTGKPVVHERSQATIIQLAAFLEKHAEITGLRIEGHTDSRGSNEFNLRLSAARAHAVARALVDRGIACGRLQPVGYGETRPIACNTCPPGHSLSRRMEFHIARLADREIMAPVATSETAGAIVHDPCTALADGSPALIAQ